MHPEEGPGPAVEKAESVTEIDFFVRHEWMDWLRGYAILAVIFHHCIYYLYEPSEIGLVDKAVNLVSTFSGNSIHLFFVLSGAGLAVSFFERPPKWRTWLLRRVHKVLVPYWIAVMVVYLAVNVTHHFRPSLVPAGYDLKVLVAYLALARNFYGPGIDFYPSLWFVSNIVGLYLVFPLLINSFPRLGEVRFLLMSLCVSYLSFSFVTLRGLSLNHQTSVFVYFVFEFAFGIWIGYRTTLPIEIRAKRVVLFMLLGLLFYGVSYYLARQTSWGGNFNKPFTSLGLFFVTSSLFYCVSRAIPRLFTYFKKASAASYYMYLIHAPIVLYFLRPMKDGLSDNVAVRLVSLGVIYIVLCASVYVLSASAERLVGGLVRKGTTR